jgi:signal peptidase I
MLFSGFANSLKIIYNECYIKLFNILYSTMSGIKDLSNRIDAYVEERFGGAGLFMLEAAKILALATVTILLVRYYLFKPFYVKGASMEPTFHEQEYLIIDELSYRLHNPERGDVIVFRYPGDPKEFFLKRVIGLPGERVKVAEGKITIYNNNHL